MLIELYENDKEVIEELIEKNPEDIQIILNSKNLEKKSILRKFFEKEKSIICSAFYEDNNKTLNTIINNFFRDKGNSNFSTTNKYFNRKK